MSWARATANRPPQPWKERWQRRQERALRGGLPDHTREPAAPFGTLARYGYLLPLEGDVLRAYNEWRTRTGLKAAPSDAQRWAFEDQYLHKLKLQKEKAEAAQVAPAQKSA